MSICPCYFAIKPLGSQGVIFLSVPFLAMPRTAAKIVKKAVKQTLGAAGEDAYHRRLERNKERRRMQRQQAWQQSSRVQAACKEVTQKCAVELRTAKDRASQLQQQLEAKARAGTQNMVKLRDTEQRLKQSTARVKDLAQKHRDCVDALGAARAEAAGATREAKLSKAEAQALKETVEQQAAQIQQLQTEALQWGWCFAKLSPSEKKWVLRMKQAAPRRLRCDSPQ